MYVGILALERVRACIELCFTQSNVVVPLLFA